MVDDAGCIYATICDCDWSLTIHRVSIQLRSKPRLAPHASPTKHCMLIKHKSLRGNESIREYTDVYAIDIITRTCFVHVRSFVCETSRSRTHTKEGWEEQRRDISLATSKASDLLADQPVYRMNPPRHVLGVDIRFRTPHISFG